MADHAISPQKQWLRKGGRDHVDRITVDDYRRVRQKRQISMVRRHMDSSLPSSRTEAGEINWISEEIARLRIDRIAVEHIAPDTWFFKIASGDNYRTNIQVDSEGDAFFSLYFSGESIAAGYGTLRQVVSDVGRLVT